MTLNQYMQGKELTDTTLKLIDKMAKYAENDDEFILGMLVTLKTDKERKKVIEYIDEGNDVSYENLILLSLEIKEQRKAASS